MSAAPDDSSMWRLLELCGVGERYFRVDLDHTKIKNSAHRKEIGKYLFKFKDYLVQGTGLYIYGDYGVGKTSLAVGVMKRALLVDCRPYLVRASEIPRIIIEKTEIDYLWGMGTVPERNVLQNCDLLVIDNLNEELSGKWQSTALEDLVRDRYEAKLATIVTSNLPPAKLSTLTSAGCASLMGDTMAPIQVKGVTWRTRKYLT